MLLKGFPRIPLGDAAGPPGTAGRSPPDRRVSILSGDFLFLFGPTQNMLGWKEKQKQSFVNMHIMIFKQGHCLPDVQFSLQL